MPRRRDAGVTEKQAVGRADVDEDAVTVSEFVFGLGGLGDAPQANL
jgi:hypothetical protein